MRIPKSWVPILAAKIAESMTAGGFVRPTVSVEKFVTAMEEILMNELTVEDRLNDEVREILKQHESDIERGRMDYRKLFDLTKQKLVRERNLIL